jgi:Tfp pilus assembly protein PilO
MQRPSRFVLNILLIGAIAIAAVAIGLVSWQGFMTDIRSTEERIRQDQNENLRINNELAHSGDLDARFALLQANLANIDQDVAEYRYMPTYLIELQAAAKLTGNDLVSIQPQEPKDFDVVRSPLAPPKANVAGAVSDTPPPPPTLAKAQANGEKVQRISLDVRGSYKSVLALLDALRRFPKLIYVRTVNLTPSKNQDGTIVLAARLETYAIYKSKPVEPEMLAPTPAPKPASKPAPKPVSTAAPKPVSQQPAPQSGSQPAPKGGTP